jgi:hypothetical protein
LYTSDAAGNLSSASSNTVDIVTARPTVNGIVLTSATGIQNNTLNAGDELTATVTFSESVTVSGTPQLALRIGNDTVQATYASGSTTSSLTFTYTIQANQTDATGISINADAVTLNSGSILSTAASTAATLTQTAVGDNNSFLVDTTAPTATAITATLVNTDITSVQGSEAGTAYLVNGTLAVTNLASITGAAGDQWNAVNIAANSATNLSLAGLAQGTYKLYTVDAAGNLSSASDNRVTVVPTVINLPVVASVGASKLIAPVKAGGNLYYFWDINGGGTADAGDGLHDHNRLDNIFNQDINGASGGGDTTNTQRYATIGGLRLALTTASDLSAIRTSGGLPTGWQNDTYWSATRQSGDVHSTYSISGGSTSSDDDDTNWIGADETGSFRNYWIALQVIGVAGPATPTLTITDSGSSNSDGITNIATVNLGNLVANTTWQYQMDGGTWTSGTGSSFNLSSGQHTYAARQTDLSGNVGFVTATETYTLDTTAPTATITDTTAGTVNSGYARFTFSFSETVVGFTAADITVTNGVKGTLNGSGSSYTMDITPVMGTGDMTVGITTGSFTDVAGNANTAAITSDVQPYNMLTQAGQAVIDLGGSGKLIAPIQVEGKWYYFWDRNGDGLASASDLTTHDVLDGILNFDINGVINSTVNNADGLKGTTDTYRYATLNSVKVALPTLGSTFSGAEAKPGTSASGTGTANNSTYDDLLAIWDALNGTGTGTFIDANMLSFPGWPNSSYHSSTPTFTGNAGHAYMGSNGVVNTASDNGSNGSSYTVLQVL